MAMTTITLTPEQSAQLQGMLDEGRFESKEEAIAYSIDLVAKESTSLAEYSGETLQHMDRAFAELELGDLVPQHKVEAFFADWRNDPVK